MIVQARLESMVTETLEAMLQAQNLDIDAFDQNQPATNKLEVIKRLMPALRKYVCAQACTHRVLLTDAFVAAATRATCSSAAACSRCSRCVALLSALWVVACARLTCGRSRLRRG